MPRADADPAAGPDRDRARRADPALRRQDLLAVTLRCLARLGPRGTTGREICRQAGVSHGLLRHYFANPDDLLLETYRQLCDRFLARFEEELPPAGANMDADADPWRALDRFFAVLFSEEWAGGDVLGAWMAFWTLVRADARFRAVNDRFNARLRELLGLVAARLPAAPGGLPRGDAVALLSAVMDGVWLDFCLAPGRLSRAEAAALCRAGARRLLGA